MRAGCTACCDSCVILSFANQPARPQGVDPTVVGNPIGFAEDVVVDDRVEFLVGLVRDREFVLPTVGLVLRHLIATQHPLLDFIANLRLAPDVLVVLDAEPEVDLHDLRWRGFWLFGVGGHESTSDG
jgi:hypothetical protein